MSYLLDTCTVSQFVRGNSGVLEKLKNTPPQQIGISSITLMELEYGLRLNPQRATKIRPVLQAFLSVVEILAYSADDAQVTAEIRAALKVKGTAIGAYDVMLAGCAKQRGLTFVTDNVAEFERIDGLAICAHAGRNPALSRAAGATRYAFPVGRWEQGNAYRTAPAVLKIRDAKPGTAAKQWRWSAMIRIPNVDVGNGKKERLHYGFSAT